MTTTPDNRDAQTLCSLAGPINLKLRPLRGKAPAEIDHQLMLALHCAARGDDPAERAARVLRVALAGTDLHKCSARITGNGACLRLFGSSMFLDLDLDTSLRTYIRDGVKPRASG